MAIDVARALGVCTFAVACGCVPVGVFVCVDDAECGPSGACEPDGYCSASADDCESGRRYSRYAPTSIAGRCVAPVSSGTDDTAGDTAAGLTNGGAESTTGQPPGRDTESAGEATSEDAGSSGSETATWPDSDCLPPNRDPAMPIVLYPFCEGEGTSVASVTDVEMPLDFEKGTIGDGFVWVDDGLMLDGDATDAHTALRSREPVFETFDPCREGGEVTVEAWVTPLSESQGGPTGIVMLGGGADTLDFGIAMNPEWSEPGYVGRLRTTNGLVALEWREIPFVRASHLVLVHTPGTTALYLDGEMIASAPDDGDLSGWNPNHDLVLGNSPYYDVRNWRGTFHLVAIYCEALDAARIATNFDAGHRPR